MRVRTFHLFSLKIQRAAAFYGLGGVILTENLVKSCGWVGDSWGLSLVPVA